MWRLLLSRQTLLWHANLHRWGSPSCSGSRWLHASAALCKQGGEQQRLQQQAPAAEEGEMDLAQMDSETLQSLAGMLYTRAELFQGYLSRPDAAVAQQLQLLIRKLDPARRALLMQRLAAVSDRRATPVVLAWAAASMQQALARLLQEGQQETALAAAAALLRHALPDLAALARAAGKDPKTFVSERELVLAWLMDAKVPLRWELLLQAPSAELLLDAAAAAEPRLALAWRALGLAALRPEGGGVQAHGALASALAELTCSCTEQLHRATTSSSRQQPQTAVAAPPDLLDRAAASASASSAGPELKTAAVGLALARLVGAGTGLYLQRDVQLVTRMLRVSPFHVLAPAPDASTASGTAAAAPASLSPPANGLTPETSAAAAAAVAGITGDLLQQVARQLVESPGLDVAALLASSVAAASAPWDHQGGWDPVLAAQLHALAAEQPDSPAATLVSALQAWRKAMLLAGVPCVVSIATQEEVAALSDAEAAALRALALRRDAEGAALEHLVLPSSTSGAAANLDLDTLLSLSTELRLALAWRLRSPAKAREAGRQLLRALHSSSVRRHREHQREADGFDTLVKAFALEQHVAELDILSDRALLEGLGGESALAAVTVRAPSRDVRLPSEAELHKAAQRPATRDVAGSAAATSSVQKAGSDVELFDALLDGEGATETQVLAAFEVLLESMEGQEELPTDLEVPATFKDWFSDAKLAVNKLSPAMLSLLRRFLTLKIRVSKADAEEAQQRTRLLLRAVQAELRRVDSVLAPARDPLAASRDASTAARRTGGPAGSPSSSVPPSPYWESLDVAQRLEKQRPPTLTKSTGAISELDPDIVDALLRDPGLNKEFSSWLRAVALHRASGPYDLLGEQHLQMDMDRYLMMRHHPELNISFEQPPRPWKEAGPRGMGTEEEFLDGMKEGLNSYLVARGMQPLGAMEWEVYKTQALAEYSLHREAHDHALREAGHSTFFNSRAEADYLTSLLDSGVPPDSPLREQAHRYLAVLHTNSSWSFAQKKMAVQRLIDLSHHFSKQGAVSERGSPFAPLFTGSEKRLVPRLGRVPKAQEAAESVSELPAGY